MKLRTYSYRNHTIRIWRRAGAKRWCFDVMFEAHLVDCGERISWSQAARAAIATVDRTSRFLEQAS